VNKINWVIIACIIISVTFWLADPTESSFKVLGLQHLKPAQRQNLDACDLAISSR
jgi:hypothetical protein